MSYLGIVAELEIIKEASNKTKKIKKNSGFESLGVK